MSSDAALNASLSQLRIDCPDLVGAMIATEEGLLLASCGHPADETAAAMASHLADSLDRNLALLAQSRCSEALIWTPGGLWGVARLDSGHVVMVHGVADSRAANLRLALGRLRRELAPVLRSLACAPAGADPES
jgi:predicted regulator of Ras-like GTPase activity (Roadblock/LC7/MglB family)